MKREREAGSLKVYAASPDEDHGMFKELAYTWNGTNIVIDIPSLQYWSMIFIDRSPKSGPVQNLFRSAGRHGYVPRTSTPSPTDQQQSPVVLNEDDRKKTERPVK
jgi:dextranase